MVDDGAAVTRTATGWAPPVPADVDARDGLRHVSCVGARFCAAADDLDVRTFDGRSWSAPTRIAAGPPADDVYGSDVADLSCPSSSFCMAVTLGTADQLTPTSGWSTWNGSSWTVHDPDDALSGFGLRSVSCTSATSCIAVADHEDYYSDPYYVALHWDGSSWTRIATFDRLVDRVTCVSGTYCLATGHGVDGPVWTRYDGTGWSALASFDARGASITALSCAGAGRCTAVDDAGRAVRTARSGWTAPVAAARAPLTAISCRHASACLATGPDAGVVQSTGATSWRAVPVALTSPAGVSCGTPVTCVVVDDHGLLTSGRAG